MMLAADILPYEVMNCDYGDRMLRGYKEQYATIHEKMKNKIECLEMKVDSFYHGDVMNMLDEIPENCGFISFPPFFKGGYEKMWKHIEQFFEYEKPEYTEFDPNVHIQAFCEKVKKLDNYIIITEREVEELKESFIGRLNTGPNKEIYFYGKTNKKHYVRKSSKETSAKPIPRMMSTDRITGDIEIKQLTIDQFEEIRALYLSTAVTKVASPTASYGIFDNGKLFGVFGYSVSSMLSGSDKLEKPTIYLLTDFAIRPTCEKNLSKLVLYCVLSKESKLLAEKLMGKRVNSITTNAFSKNPTSMKYRGLFEQYGRRELEKDKDGKVTKYNLSYGAKAGQWTIREGYEKWRQK